MKKISLTVGSANIWFCSDLHLGHANIIKYCERPFHSVEEMDEALINNWNSRVGSKDIVFYLGDLAFDNHEKYLRALNGQIYFIYGNHDKNIDLYSDRFKALEDLLEVKIGEQYITLCHYPMASWPRSFYDSWHLYGHVHSKQDMFPKLLSHDVGVDRNGYAPVNYEELKNIFARKESTEK